MTQLTKTGWWACLGLSILLFGISLGLPACLFKSTGYDPYRQPPSWNKGFELFGFGWLGLLVGQVGWFANLPLFFGWGALAFRRRMLALITGTSAFLLSLDTFRLFHTEWRADAHLPATTLDQLGPGFYLWCLSMLVVVFGAFMCVGNNRESHAVDE